ncbi:penicillin-binding protein 2 [Roseisolibacter sp. H3M3-2]|uniref:penicillin-binding protein 2 n=1 Tax=Roseisolibacter sp. H3M3-2 TaxID=3031323 RepID=UPI0023DAEA48|nr:penicillin-binding protein 2 [Roseisolibacter sp. H3M3-2]MDF1501504.1 penicillin-binding protein 2 [Roseisolibacter sp. H3M3-2]
MSFHPNDVARRSRIARLLLAVAFVLLGAGFYRAQVLQHSDWVVQAEDNRLREVPLPAPRGIIYDRRGKVIAENLPGYTVSIVATSADSLRAALRRLNEIIPYTEDDVETAVKRYNRAPNRPAVILADANFQQVSVLEEHRTEFPALIIQSAPKRWYPDSSVVASFVGYTAEISEPELASPSFEGYKAGMRVGKMGLERQYEQQLRGQEGYRFVEVDARGRVVREAGQARADQEPVPGPNLHTHVDLDLQRFTANLFADTLLGAAVALDPTTGGVLALHSSPTYNPNRFTGGVPKAYYDSLNNDERRPMYNKAIQGRYAPASTFKLATSIIGMQKGLVKLTDRMPQPCTGGFWHGRYWRCWDKQGHGAVTLAQALEKSCNVYFYQLALRLSLDTLVAGGVRLGFTERSDIDLPNETRPEFPANGNEYFRRKFPRGYVKSSEALNIAIGQGVDAQTVINMAKFYTALANEGVMSRPTVVRRAPQRERIFQFGPEEIEGLRRALAGVVSARGTAGSAALQGVTIAGKTGTAQAPPKPDHAWFVGFAPAENPQVVVAVFLEFGAHGYAAARVASKIIEAYLKRPSIAPPVTDDLSGSTSVASAPPPPPAAAPAGGTQ